MTRSEKLILETLQAIVEYLYVRDSKEMGNYYTYEVLRQKDIALSEALRDNAPQ